MLKVLDLFSGIGAFSLGLERAGMKTTAFCEVDRYCQDVLRKHWPKVQLYTDVRDLDGRRLRADGVAVDVICGGFPCQDISVAGKGAGIDGPNSGLWSEYARLIGDVRPSYAIMENVAVLLTRGLDRVLGELAALGYDAEWHCIPASAVGAPHRRDRIWIIAHASSDALRHKPRRRHGASGAGAPITRNDGEAESVADANGAGRLKQRRPVSVSSQLSFAECDGEDLADADREQWRLGASGKDRAQVDHCRDNDGAPYPDADGWGCESERQSQYSAEQSASWREPDRLRETGQRQGPGTIGERIDRFLQSADCAQFWAAESRIRRVVNGTAAKVDRRKRLIALGNSLVPQIAEIIGRSIIDHARVRQVREIAKVGDLPLFGKNLLSP